MSDAVKNGDPKKKPLVLANSFTIAEVRAALQILRYGRAGRDISVIARSAEATSLDRKFKHMHTKYIAHKTLVEGKDNGEDSQ